MTIKVGSHFEVPQGQGPVFAVPRSPGVYWDDRTSATTSSAQLGSGPQTNLAAQIKSVTAGSFAITINGAALQIGPMNFSAVKNTTDIAAIVNTGLGANGTCEAIANGYLLITGAAVASPAITYAAAPAANTDVSATLCLTAATGASIGPPQ